jgi:hypothetical protein
MNDFGTFTIDEFQSTVVLTNPEQAANYALNLIIQSMRARNRINNLNPARIEFIARHRLELADKILEWAFGAECRGSVR